MNSASHGSAMAAPRFGTRSCSSGGQGSVLIECCPPRSTDRSGEAGKEHPLFTSEYGIPVAICTDNTTVSATSQNQENAGLAPRLSVSRLAEIRKTRNSIRLSAKIE
jgi:adenosine deaminase